MGILRTFCNKQPFVFIWWKKQSSLSISNCKQNDKVHCGVNWRIEDHKDLFVYLFHFMAYKWTTLVILMGRLLLVSCFQLSQYVFIQLDFSFHPSSSIIFTVFFNLIFNVVCLSFSIWSFFSLQIYNLFWYAALLYLFYFYNPLYVGLKRTPLNTWFLYYIVFVFYINSIFIIFSFVYST